MNNDKQALNLFKTYMVLGPDYHHGKRPTPILPKPIVHLIMQYAQYEDWMETANDLAALLKRKVLNFITQSEAWAQDQGLSDAKKWLENPDNPRICESYDLYDKCIMPLLTFIAKSTRVNVFGQTVLMRAAIHGHTEALKALLTVPGINVNAGDTAGRTALMMAADNGHAEALKALLAVPGIDVNAVDENGSTALFHAARIGHTKAIISLLNVPGIDVNVANKDGWTALMEVTGNGLTEALQALLAAPGIDVNAVDKRGMTALQWASFLGRPNAKRLINEHLAELEHGNQNKCTIL